MNANKAVKSSKKVAFWHIWPSYLTALLASALFAAPAVAVEPAGICPVTQLAVTEYNGPSNGMDWPARAAVDKDGNLIVGGHHVNISTKWLVNKYDPDLNLIWSKEISNTYEMYGIAVDPNGNIIAIGTYSGDWCVVKLDAEGVQQWYKTFGTGGADYGGAVAADSQYVYAVGSMNTAMTIKVLNTSDGSQKAQDQPGFAGNLWGAAVSPITGELIAIGEVNRTAINQSMNGLVLVYDSTASQSWTWEYAGESGGDTFQVGFGVNVDSKGNVFACGGGEGTGWLQKLSSSGGEIWRRTHVNSHYSIPAINFQDNIALVGNSHPVLDLLIRQYDNEGNYQCEQIKDVYGYDDSYRGGVFMHDGSLVAAGPIRTASSGNNWYIVKYAGVEPETPPAAFPPTGPPGVVSPGSLYVYPHPLRCPGGYAVFDMPKPGTATLRIMSVRGEIVKDIVVYLQAMEKAEVFIDCSEVRKGAHMLSVALSFYDGTTQTLEPYKFVVSSGQ